MGARVAQGAAPALGCLIGANNQRLGEIIAQSQCFFRRQSQSQLRGRFAGKCFFIYMGESALERQPQLL
jgi:hypothetical protein